MVTASQTVTIERHEWDGGLVALTFTDPAVVSTAAVNDLPLAFVLHGLNSRKERHLDLCLRLARAGFRACAVDALLHGERYSAESTVLWGERTGLPFMQALAGVVLQTASEIRQIAGDLGATRYGIVGHSMGGFIALIAALSDRRAVALVNVGGSLDVRLAPAVAAQLPPIVREVAAQLDPAARAAEFWPTAISLLHGVEDTTVPIAGARRLYDALLPFYASDPQRLELIESPGVGHELTAEAADRAVAFLQRYVQTDSAV